AHRSSVLATLLRSQADPAGIHRCMIVGRRMSRRPLRLHVEPAPLVAATQVLPRPPPRSRNACVAATKRQVSGTTMALAATSFAARQSQRASGVVVARDESDRAARSGAATED